MERIYYMKKILICTLYFVTLSLCLASCSDKVYEEINTDPTKAARINPASQLSYAELQIFGDMNYVDVHRLYTYAFTQHLMGCWNTTNYGGQHRMDDNEMSRPWANLYAGEYKCCAAYLPSLCWRIIDRFLRRHSV